jgi:hypothetical protein
VGKQACFKSPQIANSQILGPIPLSQISKVCQSENRKSENVHA